MSMLTGSVQRRSQLNERWLVLQSLKSENHLKAKSLGQLREKSNLSACRPACQNVLAPLSSRSVPSKIKWTEISWGTLPQALASHSIFFLIQVTIINRICWRVVLLLGLGNLDILAVLVITLFNFCYYSSNPAFLNMVPKNKYIQSCVFIREIHTWVTFWHF